MPTYKNQQKNIQKLQGDDARHLIEKQIQEHNDGILAILSKYQARDTIRTWHTTIRAIEEFINVPLFGIEDANAAKKLLEIRLDESFLKDPEAAYINVKIILTPHVDAETVKRFCQLMLQIAAIRYAFKLNEKSRSNSSPVLSTIAEAITYLQSRRRHFVSLLYLMPCACKGSEKLLPQDALNVFLPQVEHSCVTITGLYLKLALIDALPEFTLEVDSIGALPSHWLQTLDSGFLEPERASIMEMYNLRGYQISVPDFESMNSQKIFSAAELRNSIKLLRAAYEQFGLNDSIFSTITDIVISLSYRCNDGYVIAIRKPDLYKLIKLHSDDNAGELECLLVNKPSNEYAPNTNSYEPFIDIGNVVVSNVNLLSRFLYAFKNIHLESRKRFQIHAGFIFEDMVKRDLKRIGFNITDIKRINRKEFDVVTTYGDVIYNFQCKNNWVDLSKVESNRTLYIRYNRKLTNYYDKALIKEEEREELLKKNINLDKIEHRVISRFPVITTNKRIVCYNKIDELEKLIQDKISIK